MSNNTNIDDLGTLDDQAVDKVKVAVLSRVLYALLLVGLGEGEEGLNGVDEAVSAFCRLVDLPEGRGGMVLVHWLADTGVAKGKNETTGYIEKILSRPLVHNYLIRSPVSHRRRLLWSLFLQREAATTICQILTTTTPLPQANPSDVLLWVLALLQCSQWQQAFFLQRDLLSAFPVGSPDRYLPLRCIVQLCLL